MATSSITDRRTYREQLENEIQCGVSHDPIIQPVPLACGHIFNRLPLIKYAAAQIQANFRIHQTLIHPTCPCKREIVPLTPSSSSHPLMRKIAEYREHFSEEAQKIASDYLLDTIDENLKFDAECAEVITTPDLINKIKESEEEFYELQGPLFEKVHNCIFKKLFKSMQDLGVSGAPLDFVKIYFDPDLVTFIVQAANYFFSITLDKDNHFEIDSIRPATWKLYCAYVKKYNAFTQEAARKGKFIATALAIAGISYYFGPVWGGYAVLDIAMGNNLLYPLQNPLFSVLSLLIFQSVLLIFQLLGFLQEGLWLESLYQ